MSACSLKGASFMIIPDGGMGYTINSFQPGDSKPLLEKQASTEPESSSRGSEEVILSKKAQEKPSREKPVETRHHDTSHHSRDLREKKREGDVRSANIVNDEATGQRMKLVNGHNGATLAMFPDETEAPKAVAAANGSPSLSPLRSGLEKLIYSCSWVSLGGAEGYSPLGKGAKPIQENDWKGTLARIETLSKDPAKGGKATPGSVEEAIVGVYAELAGVVAPPIVRESTGAAEFVDGKEIKWDVKSPKSPPPGARWSFDADHQIVKIRHDQSNGEKVLLNLSSCNPGDTSTLLALINRELTDEERKNVSCLLNNEALAK
jgi:hypothetical protein